MSWEAIKWARAQGMTGPKQSILVVMSTHTRADHTCYPSLTLLAKETGFSRSTVIRCVNELEAAGLIVKDRRFNSSTVYRFCLSKGIQPKADPAQAEAQPAATPTGAPVRETVPPDVAPVRESVLPAVEPVPKTVLPDVAPPPILGEVPKTVLVSECHPPSVTVTPPSGRVTPPPVSECDPKETDVNTKNIHGKHISTDHAAKADRSKRKTPLPDDFGISADVQAWAAENGFTHLDDHLEALTIWAKRQGAWCQDWDDMLKRAIRENWALVVQDQPKKNVVDLEEYARRSREEGIRELERIEAEYHARRIARLGGLQASAL